MSQILLRILCSFPHTPCPARLLKPSPTSPPPHVLPLPLQSGSLCSHRVLQNITSAHFTPPLNPFRSTPQSTESERDFQAGVLGTVVGCQTTSAHCLLFCPVVSCVFICYRSMSLFPISEGDNRRASLQTLGARAQVLMGSGCPHCLCYSWSAAPLQPSCRAPGLLTQAEHSSCFSVLYFLCLKCPSHHVCLPNS